MNYFYNTFEFIPKPGDTIDDNVVIGELGEGGRSRVYKVKNMSLEVERVIKLLKKPNEIDEDRFVTEARISANLNHPNIVHCYRFGKYNDELPYIEMEYVNGHDLHYLIRKNIRLPYHIILAILHYTCEALNVLHNCEYMLYDVKRHGVVHRDIKPGNILISRNGEVKLADFGIAKPKDLTIHTTEMQVVGTVYYLSPEQIRREELDFSTDIYSLGCVMYEMVTGKKAFRHKNLMDVMEAKKSSCYDKDPMMIVPKAFQDVINKCMAPDRLARYLNIRELQEEIDRLLKKEGIYNLKQIISDFIQDPETYTAIERVKVKKAKQMSRILPITFLSIGTLFLLFALGFYTVFRDSAQISVPEVLKKKKQGIEASSKESVSEEKNTVAVEVKKSVKTKDVAVPKVEVKKELPKNVVVNEPPKESLIDARENTETGDDPSKDIDLLLSFKKGKYEALLKEMDNFDFYNDTIKTCLAGALVETGALENASGYLDRININDGYLSYLKGRVEQGRGKYKEAISFYLASLTKPTFNGDVRSRSNYQMALCREEVYKLQPNSTNKNSMLKSFDLYLTHYSKSGNNSSECAVINSLKKQYD